MSNEKNKHGGTPKKADPPDLSIRWKKWVAVAELVIAAAAIYGIVWGFIQDRSTKKVIAAAAEAFQTQAFPVLKYETIQWIGNDPISCSAPASGLYAYVRNLSGVPIVVGDAELHMFQNGKEALNLPPEAATRHQVDAILAPGERVYVWEWDPTVDQTKQRDEFFTFFKNLNGTPNTNFTLKVFFHSLVTGRKYLYEVEKGLRYQCDTPNLRRDFFITPEAITEITAK